LLIFGCNAFTKRRVLEKLLKLGVLCCLRIGGIGLGLRLNIRLGLRLVRLLVLMRGLVVQRGAKSLLGLELACLGFRCPSGSQIMAGLLFRDRLVFGSRLARLIVVVFALDGVPPIRLDRPFGVIQLLPVIVSSADGMSSGFSTG
jgi:hypothetical protein